MAGDTFDDEELSNLLGYFTERVNLVFAYFYCVIVFENDADFTADPFDNGRAWGLQTIRKACLQATLIALRDLDDVFSPRPSSHPNDLKISDFDYSQGGSFLNASERKRINREIAHTTLPGSNPLGRRWDIFELVTKGVLQSLAFLEWAKKHFASKHPSVSMDIIYFHTRTQMTYDYFAKTIEERSRRKTFTNEPRNA